MIDKVTEQNTTNRIKEASELKINRNFIRIGIILCLSNLMGLNQFFNVQIVTANEDIYFPTDEWRTSPPSEQNISSEKLNNMLKAITNQHIGIDSIHVVRNGYLVYEKFYDYYNFTNLHQMWSSTKSIISILIGIANASGFISDLDESIVDIFSDRVFLNLDARKEAITIRHLLKMQSGLAWNEEDVPFLIESISINDYELVTNLSDVNFANWPFNPELDPRNMMQSSDWIQFTLDKPMVADPGTSFYYNSGNSHLLSAVIQRKTGMNTELFAKNYLFDPLGISDYLWFNDSMGISMGGFGLWLQPFDMLKIGYLFLNNGNWNGNQIVPAAWVEECTQEHNIGVGYGYQWWINPPAGFYYSSGFGGQHIFVKSDKNLVVAITATEYSTGNSLLIFNSFILNSFLEDIVTTVSTTTITQTTTKITTFSSIFVFLSFAILHIKRKKRI